MEEKLIPEPEVILQSYFNEPYNNTVAAARTCYSSNVVYPANISKDEKARALRDKIFDSIYDARHHTTLQHPTFQFILKQVSRQFIWSFLHSHPFYNSEQVSQRYVEVKPENFLLPPLETQAREIYIATIGLQMQGYHRLIELLQEDIRNEYFRLYPGRAKSPDEWEGSIHKRVIESARYCLPVATYTHLYHTINGVTLYRYYRLCQQFDTPLEARLVVQKMVDEVRKIDPLFLRRLDSAMPLEETLEYRLFHQFSSRGKIKYSQRFIDEFDRELGNYNSKLVDYKVNGEALFADAVRLTLGITKEEISDGSAISIVMNPAENPYLADTLTLTTLSKLSRAMFHPHFTFKKKLSHTADSQDQRHRMTPASRPIMIAHFVPDKPDFILPKIMEENGIVKEYFSELMQKVWSNMGRLIELGVKDEYVQYLIPNAFPIRFIESGDLLNLHHKLTTRLCYLAQEEIWRCCLEEAMQIRKVSPLLGRYLLAPCAIRKLAKVSPYCPEGARFCGVPVWDKELQDYSRVI